MSSRKLPSWLHTLGVWQASHPWRFVAAAILSLLPAIWATAHLGFKSSFSELLPDNKPSVIEKRRVEKRLAGAATLTVVAEIRPKGDPKALKAFVDKLVPALKGLGSERVGAVDWGVKATRDFYDVKKLYFADYKELKKVHDDVLDRYDYEVGKETGSTFVDEEDAPPPLTAKSIRDRLKRKDGDEDGKEGKGGKAGAKKPEKKAKKKDDGPSYPDGYYMNKEGTLIAVIIRTNVSSRENKAKFRADVEKTVAALKPTSFHPQMTVNYTGNFITSAEEYNAIITDLVHVGGWGIVGVLLSVFLFFLRIRTVLTMGAAILIGLLWTFGLTRYTIGHLNTSTGFLVSIIAGNGINYGIMYMARYSEARRTGESDVPQSILVAHRDTWLPTLAGSATAMLAYGSLTVTDFRGFKHFGVISGYGMMLCWVATYLFLPAILAASEGVLPSYPTKLDPSKLGAFGRGIRLVFRPWTALLELPFMQKVRGNYGWPFAKLTSRFPGAMALLGVLATAVSVYGTARYFTEDPMEYDLANVRNERKDRTAAGALSVQVDKVVGRMGQDGLAIMTDRVDQVLPLKAALEKRYNEAPANLKPFEKVVTIHSLLPKNQKAKIPLIEELRDRIIRAHKRGYISEKDWKEIEPDLPKGKLGVLAIADLPEQVARPFTEKDGTRGRIVFIVPKSGFSVWDAHYLMRWADSFRETKLPTGEVIRGSGGAVIFADMIKTIGEDAPKAIAVSAAGSILIILLAFRFHRHAWGVFIPWLIGVGGLVAFLFFKQIKLNFLNFVTLPITIGIGAEYAHNLMQRYRSEGGKNIERIIMETGGAVVLCSLTTTIGYYVLTGSINHGIVSFGLSAAVGEVTCVLAAVVCLPGFLIWMARRAKAKGDGEGDPPASGGNGDATPDAAAES